MHRGCLIIIAGCRYPLIVFLWRTTLSEQYLKRVFKTESNKCLFLETELLGNKKTPCICATPYMCHAIYATFVQKSNPPKKREKNDFNSKFKSKKNLSPKVKLKNSKRNKKWIKHFKFKFKVNKISESKNKIQRNQK